MQRDLDYRVVIDTTPTLIFSARPDGYVDYVNRACLEYFGASFEDLDGSAWTKFVHPDDLEAHVRRWREAMASGEPAISEARYRTSSGEYRWLLLQTKPLRDDRGEVIRWFGAATDIEHAKRAEETLRNAERDVRTILETIPAIVRTARPDGALDFISQSWIERMGGGGADGCGPMSFMFERVVYDWRGAPLALLSVLPIEPLL
ncbi:MAG TPA: PAS domain-containing protein [Thermoanaerobaculia bacterium]|nr:PAS domain-containing protein [Thermoanaerobaculia bacterium]